MRPQMKTKHAASREWPHYSLGRAEVQNLEASDLLALSADELVRRSAVGGLQHRIATAKTFHALQQTQVMLEQAVRSIQRARSTFAPLGFTQTPF